VKGWWGRRCGRSSGRGGSNRDRDAGRSGADVLIRAEAMNGLQKHFGCVCGKHFRISASTTQQKETKKATWNLEQERKRPWGKLNRFFCCETAIV
jgi:hypothetical protein